jgi:6-phosphogluconolactonase
MTHRFVSATAEQAAAACARHAAALLNQVTESGESAAFAVSGGATPRPMFEELAKLDVNWGAVHLFWVDERMVPPESPRSNFGMTEETLIRPARIPRRNVHRIEAELGAQTAAANYVDTLRRHFRLAAGELARFDVILRGVGADCHMASLFPGEPLIEDRTGIAAPVFVSTLDEWRVTLLPGVLLNSRHSAVLVTGADKAVAVRDVLTGEYDPLKRPAQLLSHHGRGITWFLDEAAGSLL